MGRIQGRYATIVVLMCSMAAATIGVPQNTAGVFYTVVADDLGVLRGTYSLFGMMQLLATAVTALGAPRMLEAFGIKRLVLLSMVSMTGSTAALAFADVLPAVYVCGLVRGFGCAVCANIPITMIVGNWFERANGTATSIALSFSGLAGAQLSPVLSLAITAFGWRVGYLVQAGMLMALMLPPLLLPLHVSPAEEGLAPYGARGEGARAGAHVATTSDAARLNGAQLALTSVFLFLFCLVTGLAQHFPGYATSIGFPAAFGALLLSLSMVGNVVFKLIIGILADRMGAVRASLAMIATNAVAPVVVLVGARTAKGWMMAAGALAYGSLYSVCAVGIALITRSFFGGDNYARVFPAVSLVGSVGCAVAIPAVGYVYDFARTYDPACIACLVMGCACLCLLLLASRMGARAVAVAEAG